MDSQPFDTYWSQGQYNMSSHQTAIYELPPDMSEVPSLSGSPESSTYDRFPGPLPQDYFPQIANETIPFGNYQIPMTPPDFGSDHDSPYCSPRPLAHIEPAFAHSQTSQQMSQVSSNSERLHTTSSRRRAQNRAAQRAFRERKEKHAQDLEIQLAALNEKYSKLESSHSELNAAYEKLRKTVELLTEDDDDADENSEGRHLRRRSSGSETLRKIMEMIHGDLKGIAAKSENV